MPPQEEPYRYSLRSDGTRLIRSIEGTPDHRGETRYFHCPSVQLVQHSSSGEKKKSSYNSSGDMTHNTTKMTTRTAFETRTAYVTQSMSVTTTTSTAGGARISSAHTFSADGDRVSSAYTFSSSSGGRWG
ncbi:Uu.00g065400.m01.CDS01 [Anthostomella pinea]|uniref:Uu.00g065400.m01.CDS01 n=1 Tax=Anthostomella pinea TaxID=933095 RepID=A0AAI8VUD7_9PEZI|nr:Uu.00g065400.m01.CDS01 [Anthostomella pinea]